MVNPTHVGVILVGGPARREATKVNPTHVGVILP